MVSASLLQPVNPPAPAPRLRCADRVLSLTHPMVMGIINVTPDSFSDGGRFASVADAVAHGEALAAQGAAILDVGGESTRPGATPVPVEEEMRRVLPVVEGLARRVAVVISVDTSQPELMRRAADHGATMINDVRALRVPGALEVAAAGAFAICLMHMLGTPATMQLSPDYADVVGEVRGFLAERVDACVAVGIARERLCVDPGFGFGKRLDHNLQLLRRLDLLGGLGLPVMVGLSRKSMSAALAGGEHAPGTAAADRLAASLALACVALIKGARIIRAHDVAASIAALRAVDAVLGGDAHDGQGE